MRSEEFPVEYPIREHPPREYPPRGYPFQARLPLPRDGFPSSHYFLSLISSIPTRCLSARDASTNLFTSANLDGLLNLAKLQYLWAVSTWWVTQWAASTWWGMCEMLARSHHALNDTSWYMQWSVLHGNVLVLPSFPLRIFTHISDTSSLDKNSTIMIPYYDPRLWSPNWSNSFDLLICLLPLHGFLGLPAGFSWDGPLGIYEPLISYHYMVFSQSLPIP